MESGDEKKSQGRSNVFSASGVGETTARIRRWRPTRKSARTFTLRSAVVIIVVPAVLAAIGAIIDNAIFGSRNNPNFHVQYLPYSAFVSAPLVLLRWSFADCKYVNSLEFAIYLAQTGGIVFAYSTALVSGNEPYRVMEHVREFFLTDPGGVFEKAKTEEGVYDWLEKVIDQVYNNTNPSRKGSGRQFAGRLSVFNSIRLRQNRVKVSDCPSDVAVFHIPGFQDCFLEFSEENEDRSPYSPLNFTWTNMPYETYTGTVDMSHEMVKGELASYPRAGYWTFFPDDVAFELASEQLKAMKDARWIDHQTRLIALDFAFLVPQKTKPVWGTAEFKIEVSNAGQYLPNNPAMTLNFLPSFEALDFEPGTDPQQVALNLARSRLNSTEDQTKPLDTGNVDYLGRCLVITGREYFTPFYLGMLSAAIYTIYVHVIIISRNWRAYVRRAFSYTEFLWVALLLASGALRLSGDANQACSNSLVVQTPFISATTEEEVINSALAYRYELQTEGVIWQDSRHILAMALFLHFFNFLKFLLHFAKLGTLVRTLHASAAELGSFSLSFFVIFMAFVTMFYTLFSLQAKEYSTFLRSVSTLWLGMLGEISLTDQLWAVKEWAVPAIILFTFISVFVLLTLIVAIISNAHERIKNDEEFKRLQQRDLLRRVSNVFKSKLRKSKIDPSTSNGETPRPRPMDTETDEQAIRSFQEKIEQWCRKGEKLNLQGEEITSASNPSADAMV